MCTASRFVSDCQTCDTSQICEATYRNVANSLPTVRFVPYLLVSPLWRIVLRCHTSLQVAVYACNVCLRYARTCSKAMVPMVGAGVQ